MSTTNKVTLLLLTIGAIMFLPMIGAYIHHDYSFPDGFFAYPMLTFEEKPAFSWPIFIFFALAGFVFLLIYLFPSWFWFKPQPKGPKIKVKKVAFPIWGWIGLISYGTTAFFLWTKSHEMVLLLHWSDIPLFWGLFLIIDGITYVRNGGRSMVSHRIQEVIGIGMASAFGWMLFEYLNFFVDDNWYYPFGDIIDREVFLLYAIVISTGLLPLSFAFYELFNTFRVFNNRYTNGLKIVLPEWLKSTLIIFCLLGLLGSGLFPDFLFFSLWLAPGILIALVLDKVGYWTPLTSIGKGNWRPALVFALTYLAAGLCLEGENYLSGIHSASGDVTFTMAPAYWQYNLPYVNKFHLFEMPIVGFLGYLPFSLYCWVWWIAFAKMQGIPSKFFKEEAFEKITES